MKMKKMENRNKGDKIKIPTLEELESVGWEWFRGGSTLYHPDFKVPNYRMGDEMRKYLGRTVTLIGIDATVYGQNLYGIEEDGEDWRWCFDFFDSFSYNNTKTNTCSAGLHEEGQTPIFGWFICKHCGTNLKEIK